MIYCIKEKKIPFQTYLALREKVTALPFQIMNELQLTTSVEKLSSVSLAIHRPDFFQTCGTKKSLK